MQGNAEAGADEEQVEEQAPPVGFVPDLLSDNRQLYSWAGLDFGEYNCMLLQKSLKALAYNTGATNIRFWGKILGTEADYFVAEGTADDPNPDDDRPESMEPRGSGVNTFAYWVTTNPASGNWIALPDLAPNDIDASRQIKYRFTGDLERKIFTNPFYFRPEKFYLRAQIARICHSTTLVPRHVFRLQEDSTIEIEENQPDDADLPIPVPTTEQMCNKENWVHYTRNILKCNRITHLEPEIEDDQDPDEVRKVIEAADPFEPRLKPITDDKAAFGVPSAWVLRKYGDFSNYSAANPAHGTQNYGIVVVKSTVWPGAFSFFTEGKWSQVYLGDGLKHDGLTYFPVNPPHVCADPEEPMVYPEPNPTEEVLARLEAERLAAEQEEEL